MMNQVKAFICLFFYLIIFNTYAQDILFQKDGSEKRIVFDKKNNSIIRYRDYDDPDFNLIEEKSKPYTKIKLANGNIVWLTMRDKYFRFQLGIDLGISSPIGNFGNGNTSNANSGYAGQAAYGSLNLDFGIYKFIGFKCMAYYNSSISEPYNLNWESYGFALGPQLNIKLSPRFFATIPILLQRAKMGSSYYNNSDYTSGDGTGLGLVTGLGLHIRIGQHFSIGYKLNYHQSNMKMYYNTSGSVQNEYENNYTWAYINNIWNFSFHF